MPDEIGQNTQWFYCLKHHTVEPEGVCKAKDRLGPFPDQASAARALETVHDREARLESEDARWRDS
ncbi:MAG: hypothetical protein ABJA16_13180 [Nakamurella sp.]